jgi:hypothetical protein
MFNIIGDDTEVGGTVVAKLVIPEGTLRENVLYALENITDDEMITVKEHDEAIAAVHEEYSDCCSADEKNALEIERDKWEQRYHEIKPRIREMKEPTK